MTAHVICWLTFPASSMNSVVISNSRALGDTLDELLDPEASGAAGDGDQHPRLVYSATGLDWRLRS
jgi:hypothetical protein